MFFYISLSVCLGCCVCCFSSCEQLHAHVCLFGICLFGGLVSNCWRPYHVECTGSLLTSEVKRHRARLVLGWGTAWEDLRVLPAFANPREKLAGSIFSLDFDCIFQLNPQFAIFSDGKFNFSAGKKLALSTGLRKLHSLAAIPRRMHRISSDLRS